MEPNNIYDSIESLVAFDAKDWSLDKRDAWMYGIIFGWGSALQEICDKHNWDSEAKSRLIKLNKQWNLEREKYNK